MTWFLPRAMASAMLSLRSWMHRERAKVVDSLT